MTDQSDTQIILCKRKTRLDDQSVVECGAEVPLARENLKVLNPKVPSLTAICPVCGYSNALTKEVSAPLVEMFFSDEVKTAVALKTPAAAVDDDDDPDDFRPAAKLAKNVIDTLKLLGPYKGAKWTDKLRAIADFIQTTPAYNTPQGVYGLLLTFGVDAAHLNMVLQRAFSGINTGLPGQPAEVIGVPGSPQFVQPVTAGTPLGFGGTIQQLPGGQVIVVPPSTQPVPVTGPMGDGGDVVEEILDKTGNVARRIVHRSSRGGGGSPIEQMAAMVAVMKDLGIVGSNATAQQQDPVVAAMVTQMQGLLDVVSKLKSDQDALRNHDTTKEVRDLIENFEEQIRELREEKHDTELRSLQDRLAQVERGETRHRGEAAPGEPIEKTKMSLQHDTINRAGDRAEALVLKTLEPLIDMQKTQMKMNALLMIRQVEQQDMVPPGTYTRTLVDAAATPEPSDDVVQTQKDKWRQRAARVAHGAPGSGP